MSTDQHGDAWARLQAESHGTGHDYAVAPHLRHRSLFGALNRLIAEALDDARSRGLPPQALEVGAGHGAYTAGLLAAGWDVTVTELSAASAAELRERFRGEPRLRVVLDPDGTLRELEDRRYAAVLYASVVHHIPDYIAALDAVTARHLLPGGALVTIQDPLWYPTTPRAHRVLDRVAYITWRIAQGNLRRGAATMWRRLRGVYDDTNPSDVVEYHVVRSGVDQSALRALLEPRFERVRVVRYWSTGLPFWQTLGRRVGAANTFAIVAVGARRDEGVAGPSNPTEAAAMTGDQVAAASPSPTTRR